MRRISAGTFLKKHWRFFAVVAAVSVVAVLLWYVEPSRIVSVIGVRNVYLSTFFLAIIGGVSVLTATSYYATLFTFALGGADPLLLSLMSAPGVFIGDLVFWYVGHRGRAVAQHVLGRRFNKFPTWLERQPRWLITLVIYLYNGFTPLPGDVLMVALPIAGVLLNRAALPIILGNFTLALLITLAAVHGVNLLDMVAATLRTL